MVSSRSRLAEEEVFGARGQHERKAERARHFRRRVHALHRELEIVDRRALVAARVLDRAADHARLGGEADGLRGLARIARVAILQVRAHRQLGRAGDHGAVIEDLAKTYPSVALPEGTRDAEAGRRQGFEAERGEKLRGAGVPGIRNDESAGALVKRAECRRFLFLGFHRASIVGRMEEALLLARVQFGLNIAFHILFPTITIGLAWLLVVFRLRYERTRDPAWLGTYKLWVKVFALTFAMGVVSGITMSFQFGTNWPGYMNKVGNVAGPLLAYEVLTAFFLEATFLGVMLFGMNKVSGRVHVASTIIVASGTTLSAFWILALNSWMQTPTGHVMENGVLIAGSWLAVIFNPSFPYRLTHMLLASRHHRVVPGRRPFGMAPAQGAQRSVGGEDAALRRAHRRGAGAAADFRRRPARPEHAQAPAGEDRRAGGVVEDRARRRAHPVRHSQ